MAGVARWITSLKHIRSGLDALNNLELKKCIDYLDSVITELEDYVKKEKYHKPELPADQERIKDLIRNKQKLKVKEETSGGDFEKKKLIQSQQKPDCGIGKHWVRRRKKNGDPGFCRSNPRR